jgi:hypothetical protein
VSPKFVPRQHLLQYAIEAAEAGDMAEVQRLLQVRPSCRVSCHGSCRGVRGGVQSGAVALAGAPVHLTRCVCSAFLLLPHHHNASGVHAAIR